MPKLTILSGDETIRRLEKLGFYQVRQRGSHVILKRQVNDSIIGCVVPLHKNLATGTLRGILKQANVTIEEFINIK